jgi:hypothetical protein
MRHGDFVENELARAVDVPERNRLVVRAYQELASGRRAVVFCVDVAHVKAIAGVFEDAGIRAAPVWGAMDRDDRRRTLQRFRGGELDVLTNCNVLTEGFDEPRVDCVLMARPTHSQLLYAQMVGRGTRLHDAKSDLVVIDIVDNSARHRVAGLNALFDLPDAIDLAGRGAIDTFDRLERVSREAPWVDLRRVERAEELEHVAERLDLFRLEPPDEIAAFTRFSWCGAPDGGYRLNLEGGEWVSLRDDHLGQWHATLVNGRSPIRMPRPERDLQAAIAAVDGVVRREREQVVGLVTIDAGWRAQKPTEKQLALLRRRRVPTPDGLTRGQASWLIMQSMRR